jgi:hypothetical protein
MKRPGPFQAGLGLLGRLGRAAFGALASLRLVPFLPLIRTARTSLGVLVIPPTPRRAARSARSVSVGSVATRPECPDLLEPLLERHPPFSRATFSRTTLGAITPVRLLPFLALALAGPVAVASLGAVIATA